MMRIMIVGGARPNFMKISPLIRAFKKQDALDHELVHTGQHYDYEMSEAFFRDLELPEPEFFLNAGSGTHGQQTGKIMVEFEKVCNQFKPELVVVVGDVNSTLAASIVAKKLGIKVAHIEAGLRSFDLSMPEEINRIVTDSISDFLFVTEKSGVRNLLHEGRKKENIHFVGNVMIDNLYFQMNKLSNAKVGDFPTNSLKKQLDLYGVATLHRPANVDQEKSLERILKTFADISHKIPIIFPMHPRTKKSVEGFKIKISPNIHVTEPLGYLEFLNLLKDALFVVTDSGGIQEETTAIGIPCLTLRENTERPVTIEQGTNTLIGHDSRKLMKIVEKILFKKYKKGSLPELWDGQAAERITKILSEATSEN